MSTGQLLFYPKFKGETAEGVALAGGLVYTYEPGTSTPKSYILRFYITCREYKSGSA